MGSMQLSPWLQDKVNYMANVQIPWKQAPSKMENVSFSSFLKNETDVAGYCSIQVPNVHHQPACNFSIAYITPRIWDMNVGDSVNLTCGPEARITKMVGHWSWRKICSECIRSFTDDSTVHSSQGIWKWIDHLVRSTVRWQTCPSSWQHLDQRVQHARHFKSVFYSITFELICLHSLGCNFLYRSDIQMVLKNFNKSYVMYGSLMSTFSVLAPTLWNLLCLHCASIYFMQFPKKRLWNIK